MATLPPLDDWAEDVESTPEEEYDALLRAIQWSTGFNLLFVQCSPAEGERRIEQIRRDASNKRIDVLKFTEPLENFYDAVKALPDHEQLDVLFVQGIEHSLYDYEKHKLWESSEDRYTYSSKGVPRLLGNLNLSRERFKDFNICFVFLAPRFALRYLINRAPDFFDWHSGVFEFVMDGDRLKRAVTGAYLPEREEEDFKRLSCKKRRAKVLEIQSLLEENTQNSLEKAALLFEQGLLLSHGGEYEAAIVSYNAALAINPYSHESAYNKGLALNKLEHYEEAIAAYDVALASKPYSYKTLNNKGVTLSELGRYEEAMAAYEVALSINSYSYEAFNNKGFALSELGQYEEAIASYDNALAIKANFHEAYYNKACAYSLQGMVEPALTFLKKAITLDLENRTLAKTDTDFEAIRHDQRFRQLVCLDLEVRTEDQT